MLLCLTEVGPGRLVTAGSRSGAKHSLDTCLEKQTCFQSSGGNQNRSTLPLSMMIMMMTQNTVNVRSQTNLFGEFYRTSYTETAIENHSLLTFLPLHTSHPFQSNTTFSPKDFLIKHLKQFYCDHVMKPCGLKLGHNVLGG